MALSDPIVVLDSEDEEVNLYRTGSSPTGSTYATEDRSTQLEISHSYKKRNRHLIRFTHRKVTPDELLTGVNVARQATVYMVVDTPPIGFTTADIGEIQSMLGQVLAAGTNFPKILGGQS